MKLATSVIVAALVSHQVDAFVPSPARHWHNSPRTATSPSYSSLTVRQLAAATNAPLPPDNNNNNDVPVIIQENPFGQPSDVRYSDFLKLVNADRVEKVTFSADGTQLAGADIDGKPFQIQSLPNDPDMLTTLTEHAVDVTVQSAMDETSSNWGDVLQSLAFPAVLFLGLFFLGRNAGPTGGGGPMAFGKSKAEIQMVPDTGVTFEEVAGCDGAKVWNK